MSTLQLKARYIVLSATTTVNGLCVSILFVFADFYAHFSNGVNFIGP